MAKQKPVVGNFARPPAYSRLRMADGGDLLQGPFSRKFWSALKDGLKRHLVDPVGEDIDQGHERIKSEYPLGYQAAQLSPPIGIPTSALDYAKAMRRVSSGGDDLRAAQWDAATAALSAVPVVEGAYRVGNTAARSLREALTSNPASAASAGSMFFGGGHKLAAASNTDQMFTAGEDEAEARGWAPPKKKGDR